MSVHLSCGASVNLCERVRVRVRECVCVCVRVCLAFVEKGASTRSIIGISNLDLL